MWLAPADRLDAKLAVFALRSDSRPAGRTFVGMSPSTVPRRAAWAEPGARHTKSMAVDDHSQRPKGAALTRCATREFLESCPARIAELFHYWDGLRGARRMPRRADFQPEAVVRHLPGILLIDVEGLDDQGVGIYRYRVVGTEEVRLRGHDPTGKLVQEGFFWSSAEEAVACYETIRKSRSYLYEVAEFVTPERRWRSEYAIILPFSEDRQNVSQILVYSLARTRQPDL